MTSRWANCHAKKSSRNQGTVLPSVNSLEWRLGCGIMIAVSSDPGEALFERYLKANRYDNLAYESDLGTAKRPDYLVRAEAATAATPG